MSPFPDPASRHKPSARVANGARVLPTRVPTAYIPEARRGGRVVECTGLENRRRGNSSAGSNPAPSAENVACLLGFVEVVPTWFGTAGDRLRPLNTGPQGA